jgi:hypothetical protein
LLSVPAINRSILVLSSTQKITVTIVCMAAILTACMNHDATGKARAENGAMRCEPCRAWWRRVRQQRALLDETLAIFRKGYRLSCRRMVGFDPPLSFSLQESQAAGFDGGKFKVLAGS